MNRFRFLVALSALGLVCFVTAPAFAHTTAVGATHSLAITGDAEGSTFNGRVNAERDGCERARTVKIWRVVGGAGTPDTLLDTVATNWRGRWSKTFGEQVAADYYAVALKKVLTRAGHKHVCEKARSANRPLSPPVGEPNPADWCRLQFPATITRQTGQDSGQIYGRVIESGVTDVGGDQSDTVLAEVGFGADGSDPSGGASWSWTSATRNPAYDQATPGYEPGTYEFQGSFTLPATPGTYDYAYRFSVDGGLSFVYCDTGAGSENGYSPSDAGQLTVSP